MKRSILIIAALSLFATANCIGQSRIDRKLGVVNSVSANEACLAIRNTGLRRNQRIPVILLHKPQSRVFATVKQKVNKSCSSDIDVFENASFYLIKLPKADDVFVGVGIVNSERISIVRGNASVDLNGDGKREYFRTCTSNEGVHLTVWTGKPLIGRRIWHSYYYLRYDTEPTCKKKDYEGTH